MSQMWRRKHRPKDRRSPQLRQPISYMQKLLYQLQHSRETYWAAWEQREREIQNGAADDMSNGTYQSKPGTINVFKNKNKTTDAHPDFTSNDLELAGFDGRFQISVWGPKTARNGSEFFTVKIGKAYQRPSQHPNSKPSKHDEQKANGYQSSSYVGGDDDDDWNKPL